LVLSNNTSALALCHLPSPLSKINSWLRRNETRAMPFSSKKNLTYLGGLCLLSNSINTITSRGVVQSLGTPLRSLMNIPGSARASRRDRPPHRLPTTLPTQKAEHAAAALRPDYSPIIIRLRCPPLRLPLPSACYSKNSHQAGRAGQCQCQCGNAPDASPSVSCRRSASSISPWHSAARRGPPARRPRRSPPPPAELSRLTSCLCVLSPRWFPVCARARCQTVNNVFGQILASDVTWWCLALGRGEAADC
jgi:hypothetical protein